MANRYRRSQSSSRRSRKSDSSLTGVFILLGIVIGILVTTAGYMFFSKQSSDAKPTPRSFLVKSSEKSAKKEKETAQRFEFYTLLPGMEVQLPDAPAHAKNHQGQQNHPTNKKHEPVNVLVQPQSENSGLKNSNNHNHNSPIKKTNTTSSAAQTNDNGALHTAPNPLSHQNNPVHNPNQGNNLSQGNNPNKISTAQYILQAGIFQELNSADELKAKLTLQGFSTRIQKVQTQEGQTWFRVTLGPFTSEANALQQKKLLADQKIHGILILQRPST